MAEHKVIVFGPTGAVGSCVARTAAELGAKVVLAMRDTAKAIPGLSHEEETDLGYERATADLTEAATVRKAVNETGAKRAFIYLAHGSTDHMKSTIDALKAGGVQFVVFLSSFTINGDLKAVQPKELISYIHAQVEINLTETFGSANVFAARAGYFASNNARYRNAIQKGTVKIHKPEMLVDNIVPKDIGRVCGTVLANGTQDEKRILYVLGPALTSLRDTMETIGNVVGKELQIEAVSDDEALQIYIEEHRLPRPLAEHMVQLEQQAFFEDGQKSGSQDVTEVEAYIGSRGTTLAEWAQQNRDLFV